jgi:FMN-dependent NADH-azoreductase
MSLSARPGNAGSRNLTRRFVAKWQAAYPDGKVVIRDLTEAAYPSSTRRSFGPISRHLSSAQAK